MRKYAFLAIFVLLLSILTGITLSNTMFVVQRVARVAEASGDVQVRKRGGQVWTVLGDRRQLKAGDAVRTAAGAVLELSWVDGTRIRLAENTELLIKKCTFNTSNKTSRALFRLNLGRVWVRVTRALSAGSKFEIATPTATAGVRGTVFSIGVSATSGTEISVLEGEVAVASGDNSLSVPAGQTLKCGPGSGVDVRPFSDEEKQAWNDLDIVKPCLEATRTPAEDTDQEAH